MEHDGLTFQETVEYLADRTGVQLRYTEGSEKRAAARRRTAAAAGRGAPHRPGAGTPASSPARTRRPARQFLSERGFDREAADTFGLGFAPRDGDALYKHLRQKQFTDAELVTAGLWSPRVSAATTTGSGAGCCGRSGRPRGRRSASARGGSSTTTGSRRSTSTPRTRPIYKKSHVLYGIDLARRDIARSSQAVVVEGYTDVMACHLSGVPTAVATCGTAFGEDHGRVLRRLLHDHEEFRGEVIFTFDGDEAGQKAALRAFGGDQQFVAQTYVAVEPDGLDPCDLRLRDGDAAVRELVARRIPLYRFVLGNVVEPLRPRPGRRPDRRDARGGEARLVHPRPVQGRRVRPRAGRDGRGRHRGGPRRGPPREASQRSTRPASPAARPDTGAPVPQHAARPAGPALRPRARDAEARRPAARARVAPLLRRRRRERLHPPDVPRRVGSGRRARRPGRGPGDGGVGRQAARRPGSAAGTGCADPAAGASTRWRSSRCWPPRTRRRRTPPRTCSASRS